MLTMGYIADKFGRRTGSRVTSAVMLIGSILLASSYGPTPHIQFSMYTTSLAIFGYGVGVRPTPPVGAPVCVRMLGCVRVCRASIRWRVQVRWSGHRRGRRDRRWRKHGARTS